MKLYLFSGPQQKSTTKVDGFSIVNSVQSNVWERGCSLTVILRQTIRLSWSQLTKTDFTPTQDTSMLRGKRKKTARLDSSRHTITEAVTYSFLKSTQSKKGGSQYLECYKFTRTTTKTTILLLRSSGSESLVTVWNQSHQLIFLTYRRKNIYQERIQ